MSKPHRTDFTFEPDDSERLSNLVGPLDEHLRQIELRLGVEIANRGNVFRVSGEERPVQLASRLLHRLYALTEDNTLTAAQINLHLQESGIEAI
ncbi:MAG TPA: phosphate starvation-inducible protein PhoH, partial [Dokdonella sp.]|nr:phosphate starvation-inducible protein PhoH [Dokdonella sp.]